MFMKNVRKMYLAPSTTCVEVLTEGTFAASYVPGSEVVSSGKTDVGIDNQFGEDDFVIDKWD